MVTASLVVHNSPVTELDRALILLSKSKVSKIFVIDNGETEILQETACKYDKVEYQKVKNRGFGAGHNVGIRKSIDLKAKYHLVMNTDVWWKGNILDPLINYLEDNPDTGLIAPKIFYPDGKLQYSCRLLPTPWDLFFKRVLPEKFSRKRMRKYLLMDYDHEIPINCAYLLGAFMLFRNSALKEVGLFDERFFLYPEDIDITRRVHEKYKSIYYPYVSIIHQHQRASSKNIRLFFIHLVNMVRYFNKWGWLKDPERDKNKDF